MSNSGVFADFHNADAQGRLRLNTIGTVEDLAQQQIVLRDGLPLTLYSEELEVDGVVCYSADENVWVAILDWNAIRNMGAQAAFPEDQTMRQRLNSIVVPAYNEYAVGMVHREVSAMAGAVQRQVTLTEREDEALRQRARERGVSEEELIRDAVRQALDDGAGKPPDQGHTEARREWEQVVALMRARARLPVSSEERANDRGWTREEIYDERFDRFPR